MPRGGRRPGAGRKAHALKYAAERQSATDRIAAGLGDRIAALELLAEGGFEQIEEVWEPAGLIFNGLSPAFPGLDPTKLVCIRRKVSYAAPDRASNIYLLDRILGKPGAEPEGDEDDAPDDASTIDDMLELWTETPSEPLSDSSSAT